MLGSEAISTVGTPTRLRVELSLNGLYGISLYLKGGVAILTPFSRKE